MAAELFAVELRKGMRFTFDNHWLMGKFTAEVVAVEPRRNGVMVQTTKGPVALDDTDIVVVHNFADR